MLFQGPIFGLAQPPASKDKRHPPWLDRRQLGRSPAVSCPLSTFLSRSFNTPGAEEKARKRLPPVRHAQVTTCYRARKNERKNCSPDESRVNCSLKPGPPITSPGFFSARHWDLIISWTSFSLQNTFWVAVLFLLCIYFTSSLKKIKKIKKNPALLSFTFQWGFLTFQTTPREQVCACSI